MNEVFGYLFAALLVVVMLSLVTLTAMLVLMIWKDWRK